MRLPNRRWVIVAACLSGAAALGLSIAVVARAWSNACGCGDVGSVVLLDGGSSLDDLAFGGD